MSTAIMALSIAHYHYEKFKRPLVAALGNHEGMDKPYGASPRLSKLKTNTSVAANNNLTFY